MTDRVYALYDAMETAVTAVNDLMQKGILSSNISLITRDADNKYAQYVDYDEDFDDVEADEGSGFGAVIGALTGLGVAMIPGLGTIFATGPFAAALLAGIGAGSGAVTGGITASLVDFGANQSEAEQYERVLREGGAVVIVDTSNDAETDNVEHILSSYRPLELEED